MDSKRLIFVGGAPRSGTTLVQKCLNAHPAIYGGPEFDFVSDIVELRNKLRKKVNSGRISAYFSAEELDGYIRRFLDDLLLDKAAKEGVNILSEKTPKNILVFNDLVTIYPEASFVCVVRDPRAVYNSMKAVRLRGLKETGEKTFRNPGHFTGSMYSSVKYISQCLEAGYEVAQKYPDKIHLIRYEDFVQDTPKETKALCQFLNVDWHESMLYPDKARFERAESALTNNPWYSQDKFHRSIDTNDSEKWRTELSGFEKDYVTSKLKKYFDLYGYNLSHASSTAAKNRPYEFAVKSRIVFYKARTFVKKLI